MKFSLTRQITVLATSLITALSSPSWVCAGTFEQQELDQGQIIAIARPYGANKYDLLIIQQIPGQRQCWSENGSNPVTVEPLLLNFDFTGSCERSTDSNGYSMRIDGQDYGLDYLLRIVERNGELVLIATHRTDISRPEIVIGTTQGMTAGFMKIVLNPGWRFTKRTYQGRTLSHVYLTGDSSAMAPIQTQPVNNANSSNTQTVKPTPESTPSQPIQEYTFTAPPNNQLPNLNTPSNRQNLPPVPSYNTDPTYRDNDPLNNTPTDNFNPLPPPPNSSSNLPPVSPQSKDSNSQVVPPPPLNSSGSQRQNLTDVLNNFQTKSSNTSPPTITSASNYKVLVGAKTGEQQKQLRSLYPDAFPTAYNGQSLWQVGVFSTRDNAETALNSLKTSGLNGVIIPF